VADAQPLSGAAVTVVAGPVPSTFLGVTSYVDTASDASAMMMDEATVLHERLLPARLTM